jgi:hypothetical protein
VSVRSAIRVVTIAGGASNKGPPLGGESHVTWNSTSQRQPHFSFRVAREIGIGAAVTHRPLPHHRAYGSVHGGSRSEAINPRPVMEVQAIGSRHWKDTHAECGSEPGTRGLDRCQPYCWLSADGPRVRAELLCGAAEFSIAARAHIAVGVAPNCLKTATLPASDKTRNSFATPADTGLTPLSWSQC